MRAQRTRYEAIGRRLSRQHRRALVAYVAAATVVVGGGEAAAFLLAMPERYGLAPVMLRVVLYIAATTWLWHVILRNHRRLVRRLFDEALAHYDAVIQAFDGALGLKDPYTNGHGQRVARYAVALAQELQRPAEEVERIREAGLLHDIGKIGLPDAVLRKPESPSADEWSAIRQHPAAGAEILAASAALHELAPIVRAHHERYDGTGYPDGLAGEAIPLEARIIAVADVLDALRSDRPYRSALSPEMAVAVLCEGSGTQFDPFIVRAAAGLAELAAAPRECDTVEGT